MSKPLVIVESPAKARTISKFLGSSYNVEASYGHIRDLPEKAADVTPEQRKAGWTKLGVKVDEEFQPLYVISDDRRTQVNALKALVKDASMVYLATDEDREGESISWHLRDVLRPKVPVHRLVFHEITQDAIKKALASPRTIDEDLVRAQEARRIVDRLYGYEVSPLLWQKVRTGLSAGRVQSVAVRMLVEREKARLRFKSSAWWDVEGTFTTSGGPLAARLVEVGRKRLATGRDFDETTGQLAKKDTLLLDETSARALVERLRGRQGKVAAIESKPWRERPYPPFTTSTLQQEAIRKFRWSAKNTMDVAQRLYESGWITYMRTDSVTLSTEAVSAARSLIATKYGADYLSPEPRIYKTKVKNAQEAHEAIRPAGARFRDVEEAARELGEREARLYELIWKRTVACQMADAVGDLTTVTLAVDDANFTSSGKVIRFPGFRRAYVEGSDDPEAELADQERHLPPLTQGESVTAERLDAKGHVTQPPARLTEATLVKELEARGIGRPSTYAAIIDKIVEKYAFKRGGALIPSFTAFAVTELMERHLAELVDYAFTARIEDDLDRIALGKQNWVETLRAFYLGDGGLQTRLGTAAKAADPRSICSIPIGQTEDGVDVVVRVGKFGPFLSAGEATADLPEDVAPDEVTVAYAVDRLQRRAAGPVSLGENGGDAIYLMNGRFGPFVQRGEATDDGKPARASLLPGMTPADVTLDVAVQLLSLPRTLGTHPTSGEEVVAANGRYGPYVRSGKESRSVPANVSVLAITLAEACVLLDQPARRARAAIEPLREVGVDPTSGGAIKLMKGRFGPYVTDGTTNASLPKGAEPANLTLEDAVALLARRREAGPPVGRKGKGRAQKKAPVKAEKPTSKSAKAAEAGAPKAKSAKTDKAEKPAAKSGKADKGEKSAKPEKPAAKLAKAEKPAAKAEKPAAKSAKAEKPAAKSAKAEKPAAKSAKASTTKRGASKDPA